MLLLRKPQNIKHKDDYAIDVTTFRDSDVNCFMYALCSDG